MYLGKPVIATGYGGVTDFLDDETGFVVRHRLATLAAVARALPGRRGLGRAGHRPCRRADARPRRRAGDRRRRGSRPPAGGCWSSTPARPPASASAGSSSASAGRGGTPHERRRLARPPDRRPRAARRGHGRPARTDLRARCARACAGARSAPPPSASGLPPIPVLNLLPTAPTPRLGGMQAQLLTRIEDEAERRPVALLYPEAQGYRLEVAAAGRRLALGLEKAPPPSPVVLRDAAFERAVARAAAEVGARALHVEGLVGDPPRLAAGAPPLGARARPLGPRLQPLLPPPAPAGAPAAPLLRLLARPRALREMPGPGLAGGPAVPG